MTIDSQIAALKARLERANRENIRAEANKESATVEYERTFNALREEFGVDNLDQARAKLGELEARLKAKLQEVEALLNRIDGS